MLSPWRVGIALVAVAVASSVAFVQVRMHRVTEQLVDDVNALTRPVRVAAYRSDAIDGGFERCVIEAAKPHPSLGAFDGKAPAAMKNALGAAFDGTAGLEAIPDGGLQDAQRLEPWASQVLRCGRATLHENVEGFAPLSFADPPGLAPRDAARAALKIFATQLLRQDAAQTARIADQCADAVSFTRFQGLQGGIVGAAISSNAMSFVSRPCGLALAHASQQERASFLSQLQTIRRDAPGCGLMVMGERTFSEMMLFSSALSDAQLARLDPLNRSVVLSNPPAAGWALRTYAALQWQRPRARFATMMEACADPARRAELMTPMEFLPEWSGLAPSDTGWPKFVARFDDGVARLDLLESVARVANGERPLPTVRASSDGGVTVLSIRLSTDAGLAIDVPTP